MSQTREERLAYTRQYYKDNQEAFRARTLAYRLADPERYKAQRKASRDKRPYTPHAYSHIRNAVKRHPDCLAMDGAENPKLLKEWMLKPENKICKYCGDETWHTDHIVPLSKGGKHSWDNIQRLCKTCNLAKHTLTEDEYIAWLERAFKFRSGI